MSTPSTNEAFVDGLLEGVKAGSDWIGALRGGGAERARALGVPGPKNEEWRQIRLNALLEGNFTPSTQAGAVNAESFSQYLPPESASSRLVFVDGVYDATLSDTSALDDALSVRRLSDAVAEDNEVVSKHLGRVAPVGDFFSSLNAARIDDGAFVHLKKGSALEAPLLILNIASGRTASASFPRTLVIVDENASATIVEEFVGLEGAYLSVPVSEFVLAQGARLRLIKLQSESLQAIHVASTSAIVSRDASFESVTVTLGSVLSRHNVSVIQTGPGAHSEVDGLVILDGDQVADTHSSTDHTAPNCTSGQVHKIVASGKGYGVFNGKIFVRKHAQQIAAEQMNRSLLLSDRARVHTKPQLEIFADDVRCTHGATIGQLEDDQIFYLESRGIDKASARALLTHGFAAEVIENLPVASIRTRLTRHVANLFGVEL